VDYPTGGATFQLSTKNSISSVLMFLYCTGIVHAQDLCEKYQMKYQVCIEKRNGGSNVNIDECKGYTDQTACEGANCYWYVDKGRCVIDICLGDTDMNGKVVGADKTDVNRDYGRSGCPSAPSITGYLGAQVPKTGQTELYATGDDGDLEKGIAWPNPRFKDNGNGTVTDKLTGLIWLKDANCFGLRNWYDALLDCNGLNSGECGLTDDSSEGDWRLPNRSELNSLVDVAYYNPALSNTAGTGQWSPGNPFTNVQSNFYWSSSTFAYVTGYAWGVSMYYGVVISSNKTYSYYVWPVRGGQ